MLKEQGVMPESYPEELKLPIWDSRLDRVKLLLTAGVGTETVNRNGNTPLAEATKWGRLEIVSLLLEAGANPNAENYRGETPLDAAMDRLDLECVRLLRAAGAEKFNPNAFHISGNEDILLFFWIKESPELLELVVSHPASNPLIKQTYEIETPLFWAAENHHTKLVKQMLSRPGILERI